MDAQKPRFGPFLRIYFDLSLSLSFFPLPFLLTRSFFLPTLSSFFAWNCGWLTFKERGKFNLQGVVCKLWIFPQNVTFFVSVTLTGLVSISKTRYYWKDLSLEKLMFINLYPASRGSSIFLDKLGRLKERCVTEKKQELKP